MADIKCKMFLYSINITKRYRFVITHKRIRFELYLEVINGVIQPMVELSTAQLYYFSISGITRKRHYNEIVEKLKRKKYTTSHTINR